MERRVEKWQRLRRRDSATGVITFTFFLQNFAQFTGERGSRLDGSLAITACCSFLEHPDKHTRCGPMMHSCVNHEKADKVCFKVILLVCGGKNKKGIKKK